jgi:hypothetical protein
MKCAVEIGSGDITNTQTFMKIGTCIQAIFRLFLRNVTVIFVLLMRDL